MNTWLMFSVLLCARGLVTGYDWTQGDITYGLTPRTTKARPVIHTKPVTATSISEIFPTKVCIDLSNFFPYFDCILFTGRAGRTQLWLRLQLRLLHRAQSVSNPNGGSGLRSVQRRVSNSQGLRVQSPPSKQRHGK